MTRPTPSAPIHRPRPAWAWAVAAALAALFSGCGPGVGGTGTGDSAAPGSASSPFPSLAGRPVCDSPLATALGCSAATAGAAAQPAINGLLLANGSPTSTVQAQLDAQALLDVRWRCAGWQFTGSWGETPALGARWYGWLARAGSTEPATVQMQMQTQPGNPATFALTLTDASGQRLAGPDSLAVVPAATTAGACP